MAKPKVVAALMCLALLHAPAQAFNAPKPVKHIDFLRFNEQADLTAPHSDTTGSAGTTGSASTTGGTDTTGNTNTTGGAGLPAGETIAPSIRPAISPIGRAQAPKPESGTGTAFQGLLRISQALNQGLIKSPRVASVRAQLDIQKALYAAATQMPNPVFSYDNGLIAEQTRRVGAQTTYDPPWKIAFRLLAAKRQVQATKLEILHTLWLFRNDIRRIYTELVVAQESYQMLSDLAELSQRLLNVAQKRYSVGDVPELDVLKARLAYNQTLIELEQGRRRTLRGKQQLNNILGSQLETPIGVPHLPPFQLRAEKSELLPDFDQPVPPLKDMLELAMANRLELKITKQQIILAQAQLYNAIGNIIPDPVVATGNSVSGNPPTGPKLMGFFVSLNFEIPLLTFSQGEIARLKATIRQYYRQFHAQENQITGEVAAAYNNLMAARERSRTYQEHVLRDSQEVANLARLSYEVGQSDITATLAAQQANVAVRSQYLDAVTAYQQAFTDLEQAVGEPLQ